MIFFLRVSVKNRNPHLKTSAGRCCAGAFNSGVKGVTYVYHRKNGVLFNAKMEFLLATLVNFDVQSVTMY
jgi:hypothetical protein